LMTGAVARQSWTATLAVSGVLLMALR